ncbi:helix-turn-helix domain-containing protein [Mucilaginibacter lappiensis]|uniref:AraC-like DNA-binding protein n=1 Tax=Mucilaginibacter lappiensis TaxID=354630 RepID=A0A841JAQ4_9SPHI|nr:helix-turn-helix domain-containing protein [Mucilaginibacter lappiensis]MBB6112086.1 AraC-like DNA-binding protein [Mucilaginibacter lappiensis]MBB6127917.1 AraC-like DNA-binding protein [Mucilaginibacter lappiensis]
MKLERYFPADILKPFIENYLFIESEQGMENCVLPDTSIVMGFRYKGAISDEIEGIKNNLPGALLTGLRKSVRLINYSGQTAMLLVVFKPGGAATFFKEPLHELFGLSLALDALIGQQKLTEVEEQLAEASDNFQRIAVVERFLLSRLYLAKSDLLIQHAIKQIRLTKGTLRIKDLVSTFPISHDPFEKRFRKITGTSLKQFSSIVRLRNLIEKYDPTIDLTETALAAGYFDQAHFIKDFRIFTGQTPHEFFRSTIHW